MKWTRIKPYGEDAYTYWISGIYKIVSYQSGEFLAYFIQENFTNWGDHVSRPPDEGEYGKCWKTLKSAQAACDEHAHSYQPSVKTVIRAAEIKASLIEQARQYEQVPA